MLFGVVCFRKEISAEVPGFVQVVFSIKENLQNLLRLDGSLRAF